MGSGTWEGASVRQGQGGGRGGAPVQLPPSSPTLPASCAPRDEGQGGHTGMPAVFSFLSFWPAGS